jgi:hypothetical protein
VSAFLLFILGIAIGWWLHSPARTSFSLQEPSPAEERSSELLKLSETSKPFLYIVEAEREELLLQLTSCRTLVLCSAEPERYDIKHPYLSITPCENAQLLVQLAELAQIAPLLLVVDGLESLEPADPHEDPFDPAYDLLEQLKLPSLILHAEIERKPSS